MHLLNQSEESVTVSSVNSLNTSRFGDITHLAHWGRGFQRPLKNVDEPIGSQDVGVGDKAVVDVT